MSRQLGLNTDALRRVNYALSERVWDGKVPVPAGYVLKVPREYAERVEAIATPEPMPPTPVPAPSPIHGGQVYRVRKGDSLASLAKKFNMPVDDLKEINRLSSDAIRPGQSLVVTRPPQPTPKPAVQKKVASKPAKGPKTHTVAKGETLSDVAEKYGTTVKKLKAANGLKGDSLKPGQVLRVS